MRRAIVKVLSVPVMLGLAAQLPGCTEELGLVLSEITLALPSSAREGDGTLSSGGEVTISRTCRDDFVIALASNDETALTVPATVTVPAGETSASFDLTVVDDPDYDGTQTATVTPSAVGWVAEGVSIDIWDDENTFTVSLPSSATEGDGVIAGAGTVGIPSALATDLVVTLDSDDLTELTVPADVTITIGNTSATFDLTVVDDLDVDGTQTVTVTASAGGWSPRSESMAVDDND